MSLSVSINRKPREEDASSTPFAATEGSDAAEQRLLNRARKRRHKQYLAVGVLVAAGVAYYFWSSAKAVAPEMKPLIATAHIGNIENTVVAAGTLQPKTTVDIGAQVSGLLQTLHVKAGDRVKKGELLAEIDARVQKQRVASSQAQVAGLHAEVKARQAALELAKSNATRQTNLMAARATSQQEYDDAINSLASAQADLVQLQQQIEQAEATLAVDQTQLEYTKIYAPMAGTVVAVKMTEGVTLNANQSAPLIMQIADLSTMTVQAQVSEADIGKLKPGMEVYFTTLSSGGRRWYSKLQQILPTPTVDNKVVTYTGQFDIANPDRVLLSGMTTEVHFVTSGAKNVLTVPVGALHYLDNSGHEAGGAAAKRGSGSRGFGRGSFAKGKGASQGRGRGSYGAAGANRQGNFSRREGGQAVGSPAAGRSAAGTAPRRATVKLVKDDGSTVEREVSVGLTDRVSAQILSGLMAGDRVVVGIAQPQAAAAQNNDNGGRRFRIRF